MNASASGLLFRINARGWLLRRVLAGGAVVALADWLFYGERPGVSLTLFAWALGAISALINPVRASRRARWIGGACVALGALPVAIDLNWLAFGFLLSGLMVAPLILAAQNQPPLVGLLLRTLAMPFVGVFRLTWDTFRCVRFSSMLFTGRKVSFNVVGWLVPLGLGGIFVLLFAYANPVLQGWVDAIGVRVLLTLLNPVRSLFWLFILALCWPLLHVRGRIRAKVTSAPLRPVDAALLGPVVFRRSLLLFNALFALQTLMDVGYLWGGRALPEGMSYATYAHRGAYPLMVTALIAGAFVLEATRGREDVQTSGQSRWLLLAFVAQNVLLVVSSIFRLDLYVAAYGLTEMRLAAGAWMGLVAFGLVAIVVQLELRKSRAWLFRVNGVAALAAVYAACFVNTPDLITRFNLAHTAQVTATPLRADWYYLQSLGPQIIPALDAFIAAASATEPGLAKAREVRAALIRNMNGRRPRGWRQWSLEAWRLDRYLATSGASQGEG